MKWRRIALIVSIGLHVAALIAGGIHSIWNVEELPLPAIQVTLDTGKPRASSQWGCGCHSKTAAGRTL